MTFLRMLFAAGLLLVAQPALTGEAWAYKAVESGDPRVAVQPLTALAPRAGGLACRSLADAVAEAGTATGTAAAKLFERAGAACAEAGKLTAAVAHYSQAIRHSVWRASTYARRGRLHARLGEHELAVLDYDQSIRLDPQQSRYRYLRAISRAAIGRAEAAVDDLEQVLKLEDSEVVSRLQRRLIEKGYGTPVDGEYDPGTRRALVACLSAHCFEF